MNLRALDAISPNQTITIGPHNPNILVALDQLNEIWNGEYDATDTCIVLRRTADRLRGLADAMETTKQPPTEAPTLGERCPNCNTLTRQYRCPKCNYGFSDATA